MKMLEVNIFRTLHDSHDIHTILSKVHSMFPITNFAVYAAYAKLFA